MRVFLHLILFFFFGVCVCFSFLEEEEFKSKIQNLQPELKQWDELFLAWYFFVCGQVDQSLLILDESIKKIAAGKQNSDQIWINLAFFSLLHGDIKSSDQIFQTYLKSIKEGENPAFDLFFLERLALKMDFSAYTQKLESGFFWQKKPELSFLAKILESRLITLKTARISEGKNFPVIYRDDLIGGIARKEDNSLDFFSKHISEIKKNGGDTNYHLIFPLSLLILKSPEKDFFLKDRIAVLEKNLSIFSQSTIQAYFDLSHWQYVKQDFSGACGTLEVLLSKIGKNHKKAPFVISELLMFYQVSGNLKKAYALALDWYETNLNVFGKSHPVVAEARMGVAKILQSMGESKAADSFYRQEQ